MKHALLFALILALAASAAAQVTCSTYGTTTYCSNGVTAQDVGNGVVYYSGPVYGSSQQYGNQTYYNLHVRDDAAQQAYQAAIAEQNRQNFAAGYALGEQWGQNFSNWLAKRRAKKAAEKAAKQAHEDSAQKTAAHAAQQAARTAEDDKPFRRCLTEAKSFDERIKCKP